MTFAGINYYAVAAILDNRLSVDDAIEALLTRPFKAEG